MSSSNGEKNVKVTRKSLKTLQHVASDKELAGRPKTLKHQHSQDSLPDNAVTNKSSKISRQQTPPETSIKIEVTNKYATKEVQVNLDKLVTVDDLTNREPSTNYWKLLAEKRLTSLQEVCEEKSKLLEIINDLKEENALYKQMLEEANSFVEVIKEELANSSRDDTGIDVNDVSTADDTANIDEDTVNGN